MSSFKTVPAQSLILSSAEFVSIECERTMVNTLTSLGQVGVGLQYIFIRSTNKEYAHKRYCGCLNRYCKDSVSPCLCCGCSQFFVKHYVR